MDQKGYLKILEHELRRMPKAERQDALNYYLEYFDDAGAEHEAEAIAELGEPKEIAAQILKDTAIKRLEEPHKTSEKRLSTLWLVILAIFALPLGLPILLAVAVTGIALFAAVIIVGLSFGVTGIALCGSAVVCFIAGFTFLPVQPADGFAVLGSGLFCLGVGLLCFLLAYFINRGGFSVLAGGARRFLSGGKKHEEKVD